MGGGGDWPKQKTKKNQNIKTYEVRILQLLPNSNIIELDIQILIHRFQRSRYADVILELDCDGVVY